MKFVVIYDGRQIHSTVAPMAAGGEILFFANAALCNVLEKRELTARSYMKFVDEDDPDYVQPETPSTDELMIIHVTAPNGSFTMRSDSPRLVRRDDGMYIVTDADTDTAGQLPAGATDTNPDGSLTGSPH